MQIYEKPKAKWKELAHQHRKGLFQTYWGSPIIKLGEHQYIEVLYVEPSDRPDLLYAIRPQGVIVLCDANSVVTNVTIIKKIMELSLVLASCAAKSFLDQVEFIASVTERDAQKKISAPEWIMWFKNQERVLCNYASANGLKTFLCLLEEKQRALAQRALEANKMLRVLNAILDEEIVPAEHIQALERLDMRAKHWNIRNTQILIEMSELAAQLEQQLLNQHDIWKENKQIEGNCDRAVQFWQAIVQAAKRPIARLERTKCAEFLPEKTHEALLKERINEKMAVYKVPIEDRGTDSPISWNLTDDDLERMVSELPPLPQSPPWRATPTRRLANHILVITMIIVSLLGIGIAVMRMVIGGVSFSAAFQVLFFISWMFFFARLWIKR